MRKLVILFCFFINIFFWFDKNSPKIKKVNYNINNKSKYKSNLIALGKKRLLKFRHIIKCKKIFVSEKRKNSKKDVGEDKKEKYEEKEIRLEKVDDILPFFSNFRKSS